MYAMSTRAPEPDDEVEVEPGLTVRRFVLEWSRSAPDEARRLIDRFPALQLRKRPVLAIGRGAGDLGIELARRHAARVLALDMARGRMALAQKRLREEAQAPSVEIRPFSGDLAAVRDNSFDVIVAVDAFRRYGAERSSRHMEDLVMQLSSGLAAGGLLAIRFGPPWKAPYGGGVDSRLPWAHLIFPEAVIFDHFRRARQGSDARTFDDIGINRITLHRFKRAMDATGLECLYLETNVGDRRAHLAMRSLTRLRPLQEYFTQNVYGLWRRSPAPGPPALEAPDQRKDTTERGGRRGS